MMICFSRFIEYGEYKENLYGTSLDSIHRVLDQNKVCLVDVQPEVSLKSERWHSLSVLYIILLKKKAHLQKGGKHWLHHAIYIYSAYVQYWITFPIVIFLNEIRLIPLPYLVV